MLENRNILVADDNPAMRFVMSESLRMAGALVLEAASGTEALMLASSMKPDLLLLDVQLPGMSGIEVCAALRANAFDAPILACSDADEPLRRQCLASGMNAVLPKPCPREVLLEQIRYYIKDSQVLPQAWQGFSYPSFLEFCAGDEAFMHRLLAIASKALPKSASELRAAANTGNLQQIADSAHRVRSSVEGLGLTHLSHMLRQLEQLAGKGQCSQPGILLLAQKAAKGLEQAAQEITLKPFCL
ncbi:MAG: response regulator [Bacteroidetes bacterium]|nr:response regulator [Bacteroidota bacterium]MBS1628769.1 response regulator [Bacteroidota bacterium]